MWIHFASAVTSMSYTATLDVFLRKTKKKKFILWTTKTIMQKKLICMGKNHVFVKCHMMRN